MTYKTALKIGNALFVVSVAFFIPLIIGVALYAQTVTTGQMWVFKNHYIEFPCAGVDLHIPGCGGKDPLAGNAIVPCSSVTMRAGPASSSVAALRAARTSTADHSPTP